MLRILILLLLWTDVLVLGSAVRGAVGQSVTLPCTYRVKIQNDVTTMCWGRGPCPASGCSDDIVKTNGWSVTWSKSTRYQLKRDIPGGDVSLTIEDVMASDSGTYCCRVEIPGWFNDEKHELSLTVDTDSETSSPASRTSTSVYSTQSSDSSQTQVTVSAVIASRGQGTQSDRPSTLGQEHSSRHANAAKVTYTLVFVGGFILMLTLAVVTGFYLKRQNVKKRASSNSPLPMKSTGPGCPLSALERTHCAEANIYNVD